MLGFWPGTERQIFRTRRVFITFLAKFNLYGFTGDICVAYDILYWIFFIRNGR